MRICLLGTSYPPASTEGIARQRQVLATELAHKGHDVHVIACGAATRTRHEQGVWIHEVAGTVTNYYSQRYPNLNGPLTRSQALCEGLQQLVAEHPCDIVDVPLWSAPGFITLQVYHGPTVLWLQTTSAQLIKINRRRPRPDDRALLALERICLERAGGLLADSRIALESTIHDYQIQTSVPSTVAYLGLPPLSDPPPEREVRAQVQALVVGRLEQRKGTPLLFELLPTLLYQYPELVVRFVGRDNSAYDGWGERYGTTYSEYFQRRHPALAGRVIFEGYIDDIHLDQYYRQADLLLVPSIYESFGIIYLEAMRSALPVATFAAGGASEIFANGEADGAILVPPGDRAGLVTAMGRLIQQPALRRQLGERGLSRFKAAFGAGAMADATIEFYQEVIDHHTRTRCATRMVYQVMEALDIGDAVSAITRRNAALLSELGQATPILARYTHQSIKDETRPLHHALSRPDCAVIYHYWGYSSATWLLRALRGPKAVHYHNITPPYYFAPDSDTFRHTANGYTQLRQIADSFDLIIGDSRYNIDEFARYMSVPKPTLYLYPAVDVAEMQAAPYDQQLLATLRQAGEVNIVFVGRVVRNKRPDELMRLFDYYYREINRYARLWLVGNDGSDRGYRAELEQLRQSMAACDRIMFTGKVPDTQVNAYYRSADVFVCASEHEGFCMPIAQAMAFGVPVLAYAAAAVPETMGDAGILIHEWDSARVGELMHLVITDRGLRERLLAGQRANLDRFTAAEIRLRLDAAVRYLRGGEPSPLFGWSAATQTQLLDDIDLVSEQQNVQGRELARGDVGVPVS